MFMVKVTFQGSYANSCLFDDYLKTKQIYEKACPKHDLDCFFSVKDITGCQLLGVRGLPGHLLHIITFLVAYLIFK